MVTTLILLHVKFLCNLFFLKPWVCKLSCSFFYQFTLPKNALQVYKHVSITHFKEFLFLYNSLQISPAKLIKSLQKVYKKETKFSIWITLEWVMETGPHHLHRSYLLFQNPFIQPRPKDSCLHVCRKLRVRVVKKLQCELLPKASGTWV